MIHIVRTLIGLIALLLVGGITIGLYWIDINFPYLKFFIFLGGCISLAIGSILWLAWSIGKELEG